MLASHRDVLPVAGEAVGRHPLTVGQHGGDDVLAEVVGGLLVGLIGDEVLPQLLPVEDVDAHGGQVALGLFGLLLELVDHVVFVHVHDAEPGRLLHGDLHDRDGAGGVHGLVVLQHLLIVHLIDVVAGQDEDVVGVVQGDKADVLIDGVGGTLVPGALVPLLHIGGQDVDAAVGPVQIPGLAGADIAVQLQRAVLGQHTHGINAGVDTVTQGEVDDAVLAPEGDGGFCYF